MNANQLVNHMITMELSLAPVYARVVRAERMKLQSALSSKDQTRTAPYDPYVPGGREWRGRSTIEVVEVSREQIIADALREARRVADMYEPYC